MKAKEVLNLLRITRQTLTNYVKNGIIKVEILKNGRYDYDNQSVYSFLNKNIQRKTYIYMQEFQLINKKKTLKIKLKF